MTPTPLIVRKSRWRSVVLFGCSLLVFGPCLAIALARGSTLFGWAIVIISGLSAAFYAGLLIDARPHLLVTAGGIDYPLWNVGTIPWPEIRTAFLHHDGRSNYVCLTLRNPDEFFSRTGRLARAFSQARRETGFGDFSLKPADLGLDPSALLDLVQQHLELAHGKATGNPTQPGRA